MTKQNLTQGENIRAKRVEGSSPPDYTALAEQLAAAAGVAFTARWQRRPLTAGRTGLHALTHPTVGSLMLNYETLELSDHDYQRILLYLPADAATASRLDDLIGRRPGQLRLA